MSTNSQRAENIAAIENTSDQVLAAAWEQGDAAPQYLYEESFRKWSGDQLRWVARVLDLRDHLGLVEFQGQAPASPDDLDFELLSDESVETIANLIEDARETL